MAKQQMYGQPDSPNMFEQALQNVYNLSAIEALHAEMNKMKLETEDFARRMGYDEEALNWNVIEDNLTTEDLKNWADKNADKLNTPLNKDDTKFWGQLYLSEKFPGMKPNNDRTYYLTGNYIKKTLNGENVLKQQSDNVLVIQDSIDKVELFDKEIEKIYSLYQNDPEWKRNIDQNFGNIQTYVKYKKDKLISFNKNNPFINSIYGFLYNNQTTNDLKNSMPHITQTQVLRLQRLLGR